ncbi:MAG: class I SAM-dependent DNA methyltransferase [Candidatus Rokuibacteriota bacterium]
MPGSSRRLPTAPSPADGLSPAFLALLAEEDFAGLSTLNVGTGRGRLATALAPRCRRVVGVDLDPLAIEQARRAAAGVANVEFVVADAEATEYGVFAPDAVVAHLCMSDAIMARAGRALAPGRVFAFVAFHADQWRETGRRSRFAYDEAQARTVLEAAGFAVEHLSVEHEVRGFGSVEEGLAAAVALEEKWKADGRWFHYIKFLEEGGRTLTRSHLHVKARRR